MGKKIIISINLIIIIVILFAQTGIVPSLDFMNFVTRNRSAFSTQNDSNPNVNSNGVQFLSKVNGNYLYFYKNGTWEKQFISGVNIGAGKPGIFPGELTISYDEYYRWFGQIKDMNVNSIRVYTTQRPQFYAALLDFNKKAKVPLMLYQGIWIDESKISSLNDVYAQGDKILNDFIADSKNVVDVIHGNVTLPARNGFASGNYMADVSQYVAGFILGVESDPKFVLNTNRSNPTRNKYEGEYLYTISASPFESFWCAAGDNIISYETNKYKTQRLISFTNWVTTDLLTHPNEQDPDEDLVEINESHIKASEKFSPGIFATYHVYPYYPDSMNFQSDYASYVDPYGKINPYRAYLHDLKTALSIPIIVGEFGIPTSRGLTHKSLMGYNQGQVDETDQGAMLLDMFNSMNEENYAGGFIFTWQDEWFKRTWNTVNYDLASRRPFWSNIQTSEQNFGILAFDPGANKTICNIDGDITEWTNDTPIINTEKSKLYIKSDERYMYIMADVANYNFDNDTLVIPIDTKPNQGNTSMKNTNAIFDKPAEFVISINGKNNSRIVVDSYYNAFYYLYAEKSNKIAKNNNVRNKNSGVFDTMQLCTNYEMTLPKDNKIIPFSSYETGLLKYGNSNPTSPDYKSLSDFMFKDGKLEIRIPWQLLNVTDPSSKMIMDDFYQMRGIVSTSVSDFNLGIGILDSANPNTPITLSGKYSWTGWEVPTFHERLKPAYEVLKNGLLKFYTTK